MYRYKTSCEALPSDLLSKAASKVLVLQGRLLSQLLYTFRAASQCLTRVKLNRVFFPRCFFSARSLSCVFAVW